MEMSDCIWQHQKYARPETYRATLVFDLIYLLSVEVLITRLQPKKKLYNLQSYDISDDGSPESMLNAGNQDHFSIDQDPEANIRHFYFPVGNFLNMQAEAINKVKS